ncbi:sulfatase [Luteolibacter yonseiensis]|uniref:Sulfatase n=1 Tax=Luteolibacter yonseiensis TaxID=1144680 RepID=A0A934R9L8_9BACT|nr:sulfatase [Luteolibacter yonseiensis]MBK1818443.1 sulfatase [Luteolibacter yonseiensis]
MKKAACLIALLALPPHLGAQEKSKPNVLLICVDDLKPTIGAYGDKLAVTPNLDRLAARGMRFDYAYCNQSVCSASRNNLMLGSRSTSLGIYDLSQNFRKAVPDAVTLSQYFMNNGYRAEAVGKILHSGHGNSDDAASWSVPTITEKVVEYADPASSAGGRLTREEAYFSNKELGRIGQLPKGAAWEIADVPDNAYSDGRIADEGIKRLQAAAERKGTPFFLGIGFTKPHLPFTAPRKYWDMHDPTKFKLAENTKPPQDAPPLAGKKGGEITNYEPIPDNGKVDDENARKLIHGYYAATSYMDAQLGRVLDELDRQKLWENTIIVLWGDHGWHLGDHGYWTKHTNYEQANHIPLLIIAPGMKPGSTRQLTETVDIYPTVTELAGLPKPSVPQPIDGVSLIPVLKDPSVRLRDHAYHCFPRGEGRIGRAIRTERYRFVEWKVPGAPADTAKLELYDYKEDPTEKQNLATKQPEVVKEMQAILARHPEAEPKPLARKEKK